MLNPNFVDLSKLKKTTYSTYTYFTNFEKKISKFVLHYLFMIKIGKKLKQTRENKNLSQEDLANSLDVSQKTISNWESDKGFPTLSQLSVLEDALQINILSWFEEKGISFKQKINHGDNGIIHKESEKLIEQYEKRIAEKDQIIAEQKEMIQILLVKK